MKLIANLNNARKNCQPAKYLKDITFHGYELSRVQLFKGISYVEFVSRWQCLVNTLGDL